MEVLIRWNGRYQLVLEITISEVDLSDIRTLNTLSDQGVGFVEEIQRVVAAILPDEAQGQKKRTQKSLKYHICGDSVAPVPIHGGKTPRIITVISVSAT